LRVCVERADVAGRAERERRSIEDAAHAARYEFFERVRVEADADVVAVGHTRDDQAETFLLRLLRGAGPHGLAGMYPRSGHVVRPLLGCRRGDLKAYLGERSIGFVEDESNLDASITRNRVRAELLPLLEARFNPGIVEVLADEAALARETWQWMERAADELRDRAALADGFDVAVLRSVPPALARALLWRAMSAAGGGRSMAFAHVQAALDLVMADRDGAVDVPGHRVQRIGSHLVLRSSAARAAGQPVADGANLFRYSLSIPGEVRVVQAGCVVSAEALETAEMTARGTLPSAKVRDRRTVIVRRDMVGGQLAVRNRRPGDRFRPIGLGGKKKLQDFFVDRKVARARRDDVPLVVDQADRIVWVAGFGIDETFQVTDAAQGVLLLKLRPV
jgi:tRNA(Ile)-lysidine synthase